MANLLKHKKCNGLFRQHHVDVGTVLYCVRPCRSCMKKKFIWMDDWTRILSWSGSLLLICLPNHKPTIITCIWEKIYLVYLSILKHTKLSQQVSMFCKTEFVPLSEWYMPCTQIWDYDYVWQITQSYNLMNIAAIWNIAFVKWKQQS